MSNTVLKIFSSMRYSCILTVYSPRYNASIYTFKIYTLMNPDNNLKFLTCLSHGPPMESDC